MNNTSYVSENCPSRISTYYYTLTTILACSLNIILFLLIYSNTHLLMKPYKKILYSSTCIDFVSALFQFSTQVRSAILGDDLLLTVSMDGFLPKLLDKFELFQEGNLNYVLILEYWGCYTVVCFSFVPFLFRYLMTCWNYQMSKFAYSLLLSFVLLISLTASVLITHLSAYNHEFNVKKVPQYNPNCFRFLPQFNYKFNIDVEYNQIYFRIWDWILVFYQYSGLIVIYCALRIFLFFRRQARLINVSSNNASLQHQITLTICGQAFFPFLIYYLPAKITWLLTFNNLSSIFFKRIYYNTLYLSYSILPISNPLFAILFISSYRKALIQFVVKLFMLIYSGTELSELSNRLFNANSLARSSQVADQNATENQTKEDAEDVLEEGEHNSGVVV